ncbi:LamG-like jellyroll fold domain-containing protein [Pseudoalteromonas sp. YIC-656]|uniref:LamG-like jellyroll fold domain-containing protein n=1 Tax=Pseudoalteromonas pernae TaxID=3118054 RepID=UPI00324263F6
MRILPSLLATSIALALTACNDGSSQSFGMGEPVAAAPEIPPVEYEDPTLAGEVSFSDVTVHDPSVMRDAEGTYYIYGSHLAAAKSTDLLNWELIASDVTDENPLFNTYAAEAAEGIEWVGGHVGSWAADAIQLNNGRYYFYYDHCALPDTGNCVSRSYLGVAVSDSPEGPFTNLGLILKTGHVGDENPGINGEDYNGNVHPNAIDPDVFFDKEGRLWMVYGSYSGGIWIMEMNPETGMALPDQGYGKKLMGGFYSAIEGPYMLYSPETDYYYLFTSFGGYEQNDGYNMRISRSKNPDGPFEDYQGQDMIGAAGNWDSISPYGVKIMGGFEFNHNVGEEGFDHGYMAPGHNSAYYDETTGNHYLIFHTRFPNMGEGHSVRVHEMFTTEDGWLVASPHRYVPIAGANLVDEIDAYGTYQFIIHGLDINRTAKQSSYLRLEEDDVISGDYSGSWKIDENSNITLNIDDLGTFKGVAKWQYNNVTGRLTPTFSVLSAKGGAAWGSELNDPGLSQVMANIHEALVLPQSTQSDVTLPSVGAMGASISWVSDKPEIINTVGQLNRPNAGEADATVTLTATIELQGQVQTKTFTVTVPARKPYNRVAHYSFSDSLADSLGYQGVGQATAERPDNITGNANFTAGYEGQALQLNGSNGVRLPDGLIDNFEYTVSMWLNPTQLTQFTTAFFGAKDVDNWLSLVPWSWDGNTMLWSGSQVWIDGSAGMQIPAGSWSHVAFSVKQGSLQVYVNGEQKYSGGNFQDLFSNGDGLFALGVNHWDIPYNGLIDDVKVYEGALSATEIKNLDVTPLPANELLASATELLSLGDTSSVRENLRLPRTGAYASAVQWQSSNTEVVSTQGEVTRPEAGESDAVVTLTATITLDGETATKSFEVVVRAKGLPAPRVAYSFDNDTLLDNEDKYPAGTTTGPQLGSAGPAAMFADGVSGRALHLDGSYGVELPDNLLRDNTYSVSLWVNPEELTQFTPTFFAYATTESWISLVLKGTDGVGNNSMVWSGTNWYDAGMGQQTPINAWSHIVFVNNGNALNIYFNGEEVYSGNNFPDVFTPASFTGFAIGVNFWDLPYKGLVDELMIFDDALSARDAQQLYSETMQ